MKKVKKNNRQKSFWGALIGAGISAISNLVGASIQSENQKRIAELQYAQQKGLLERQNTLNEYNMKLQEQIAEQENDGIYDELRRKNYKCGGKIVKRKKAEFGLSDLADIGSSLLGGLSSLGVYSINNNTQNKLAAYQMKLMEDKFNSETKKFYSYTGQQAAKNLREYLNGDKDENLTNSRYKNLFQNKRLYLS